MSIESINLLNRPLLEPTFPELVCFGYALLDLEDGFSALGAIRGIRFGLLSRLGQFLAKSCLSGLDLVFINLEPHLS